MTNQTEPQPRNDESSSVSTPGDDSEGPNQRTCRTTVDPETREDVLTEYQHRCQACGRRGPEMGGLATLHVHHIERNPDGMDEHNMANLTLLCRSCHSWFHQQRTPDDSPVKITEADQSVLLPQDIEILRYLAENGPARTGDIASGLQSDYSVSTVRERLWVLMGLENLVEARDQQIVDKDVDTGEWGLTEQIENSARGHIPDEPQLLLQRMEDEQVRQALERGVDRNDITEVLGISRRTTFNKHKRACAYDFPLDAFNRGGRPTDSELTERNATMVDDFEDDDEQQSLDSVAEQSADPLEPTETWGNSEPEVQPPKLNDDCVDHDGDRDTVDDELRVHLKEAISVLQEVDKAL